MSNLESVIAQMREVDIAGLQPGDLVVDGKLHRFKPDNSRDKTAWYVLYDFVADDGTRLVTGAFGDWKQNQKHTVKLAGIKLSNEEREKLKRQTAEKKRQAELKRKELARRAALRAQKIWPKLSGNGESPYVERKKITPFNARFSAKKALVIPIHDMTGTIYGLQVIHAVPRVTKDGSKIEKDFFPFGVSPKGNFCLIGAEPEQTDTVIICEGYATGASIHEASGLTVYVAFNVGNLKHVAELVRETYPDVNIVIAADDDYKTLKPVKNPGVSEAKKAARKVKGSIIVPLFRDRNGRKWTDFNDLHVEQGLEEVKKQFQRVLNSKEDGGDNEKEDWFYRLSRNESGQIKPILNNVKLILMYDKRWVGVLQYSEFDYDIHKVKMPPFEDNPQKGDWNEVDTERLRCWLEINYGFTPSEKDTVAAVRVAAENFSIHPIKDYLESLEWDGVERLDTWMIDYLGADDTEYTRKVSSKFLIAATARVYATKGNGVKVDNVLILEGLQGEGKSTTIEAICGSTWFSETPFELGSKEGYQQLRGVWFQELAELDAFNKAESTRAKAFFSAKEDYYRPSYARKAAKFPRQCVFVGSTNQDQYLKDVTGNRRYWPIKCNRLKIKKLREARDQLWAEAYVRYKNKEPWWVLNEEKELFTEQQEDRFSEDVWESKIVEWLYEPEQVGHNRFTTAMIMEGALGMAAAQMKPPEAIRVGYIMSRIGWRKVRGRDSREKGKDNKGKLTWFYERPSKERIVNEYDDDDLPF